MGNISDYFITAFDDGDFLSTHNDGAAGSVAWVLHLVKDWNKSRGGELRFNGKYPTDFSPSFNQMNIFLTRPGAQICQERYLDLSNLSSDS